MLGYFRKSGRESMSEEISLSHEREQATTKRLFAVINGSYEFGWFGIRVMKKALAQLSECVIPSFLTDKGLMYQFVVSEFGSQPPGDLLFGGSVVVTMQMTQAEPDSFRGDNDARLVQQIEDVSISPRHPRDWWRHLT